MGIICNKKTQSRISAEQSPDPFSGLRPTDKDLIRKTWLKITDKNSFAKVGITFFMKLFTVYPYLQDYFMGLEERHTSLTRSPKFRTHSIKFVYGITAYVENLDDSEVLESLMLKISEEHTRRNITYDDMLRMKEVFLEFMQESLRDTNPDIINAWDKLFSTSQQVYAATLISKCSATQEQQ